MKTVTMDARVTSAIQSAREVILAGGLIAYPTDTVYGLSASPFQETAIERIFAAKGRDFNKAIAILVGDLEQLPLVTSGFTESAEVLARKFWPGALTLVVPIASTLPGIISPFPTIGIRMPDHPFALTLLRALGPLATTSANISGQPDATNSRAGSRTARWQGRFDSGWWCFPRGCSINRGGLLPAADPHPPPGSHQPG